MEGDILASMILEYDKKYMELMKTPNPHKYNIEKEDRIMSITPVDTSTLTLHEAFEYTRDNEMNSNVCFQTCHRCDIESHISQVALCKIYVLLEI